MVKTTHKPQNKFSKQMQVNLADIQLALTSPAENVCATVINNDDDDNICIFLIHFF